MHLRAVEVRVRTSDDVIKWAFNLQIPAKSVLSRQASTSEYEQALQQARWI